MSLSTIFKSKNFVMHLSNTHRFQYVWNSVTYRIRTPPPFQIKAYNVMEWDFSECHYKLNINATNFIFNTEHFMVKLTNILLACAIPICIYTSNYLNWDMYIWLCARQIHVNNIK